MKVQSRKTGAAIGVVLIIFVFIGMAVSSHSQEISNGDPETSKGDNTLALTNTGDTEIIVNELSSGVPETGFFPLSPDNYYEYTKEELFDYYGVKFDISEIFPDMIEDNTDSYGIYKYSDGSDMQGHNFSWVNLAGNESVSIEIIKGGNPKTDINLATSDTSPIASIISGENVSIFYFENDIQSGYYAEFDYKNLGFSVYGYDFNKEDFVSILSYLISC